MIRHNDEWDFLYERLKDDCRAIEKENEELVKKCGDLVMYQDVLIGELGHGVPMGAQESKHKNNLANFIAKERDSLREENEELKRNATIDVRSCACPKYAEEITSLRERLAEYENLPSGMRSAKLHVENESLRESLKLAVEVLTIISGKHETLCVDDLEDARFDAEQTLATIKAKGEL